MKTMKHLFLPLVILSCIAFACDDKDDDSSGCEKSATPGIGGNKQVSGLVRHHNLPIPDARIFIKFNATEFPGSDTSVYNLSVTADSTAYYEFAGLKSGYYYLYSTGFDSGISLPVDGGVPLEICETDSTIQKNVPVTEEH